MLLVACIRSGGRALVDGSVNRGGVHTAKVARTAEMVIYMISKRSLLVLRFLGSEGQVRLGFVYCILHFLWPKRGGGGEWVHRFI